MNSHKNKGITLVELLVVIALVGIMSSIVYHNISIYKAKSRDNLRIRNLSTLKDGMTLYYAINKNYPKTCNLVASNGTCTGVLRGNGGWVGICPTFNFDTGLGNSPNGFGLVTDTGITGWISELAPEYILKLPRETNFPSDNDKCYIYKSDGKDFKIISYRSVESGPVPSNHFFKDKNLGWGRDVSYTIYTPGAELW